MHFYLLIVKEIYIRTTRVCCVNLFILKDRSFVSIFLNDIYMINLIFFEISWSTKRLFFLPAIFQGSKAIYVYFNFSWNIKYSLNEKNKTHLTWLPTTSIDWTKKNSLWLHCSSTEAGVLFPKPESIISRKERRSKVSTYLIFRWRAALRYVYI